MLHRFHQQTTSRPAASDISVQLDWVASHYRRHHLVVVVSDEPDVCERLRSVLPRLTARHDVMWAMVADLPAVSSADDEQEGRDVSSGRFVLSAAAVGAGVVAAYHRAEDERRQRLSEFMIERGVPHTTIAGSAGIRTGLTAMTEVLARAG
jgi:phosphotransferase system  glucose/maltose/N-acetylglucosamine-specific IIC component